MESRGLVANNVAALNSGFYIQRSELEVVNNTIIEDVLLVETKEGLKPSRLKNNIILGSFKFDTAATVTDSLFRDGFPGDGNIEGAPTFIDDGLQLTVQSSSYSTSNFYTTVHLSASIDVESLDDRVVISGKRWGVVRSFEGDKRTFWGVWRGGTAKITKCFGASRSIQPCQILQQNSRQESKPWASIRPPAPRSWRKVSQV